MKVTATFNNYREWRAALKAAFPTAELRMSKGGHLDEYAALPTGKAVAWFGHDNDSGWIDVHASTKPDFSGISDLDLAATVPKVNSALRKLGVKDTLVKGKGYYYFWGDEASDWYSSSVAVYRIGQLTLRQVLEEYYSLKGSKGKTMSKVNSKIKATAEFEDSPWQQSKWWPKNARTDDDPFKLAFSDMVKDAIKAFPAPMKTALGHYLQDPFGQIENFVYAFEELLPDIQESKLEDLLKEIVDTATRLAAMHEMFVVTVTKFAPLSKKIDLAYDEDQAEMLKLAAACAKIPAPVIRFGHTDLSVRVVNGGEFVVGERDSEFDFDDKHRFRVSGKAQDDANTFVDMALRKMTYDDDQFTTDILLGTTSADVKKGKLDPSILISSGDNEEASLTAVADTTPTTAAPKEAGTYTYFKLRSAKLTINRRGKNQVFKRGDPLGWRMSGSGKFLRLISPLTGPTVVYSIEINDDVLKWLDRQDPNAKRKRGQLKSGRPEDAENRLEGYVVTDGHRYYKLEPKPTFSKKLVQRILYSKEADAKKFASKFPERKLKVKEVFTKDLGKSI